MSAERTPATIALAGPADGDGPLLASRYRLGAVVGRGATADVHRARDVRLDRDVAVKLARPGADLPGGPDRIRAEAGLMARLQHPGLVGVFDIGVHEGRPYVVMELVGGGTLGQLLAAQAEHRLPLDEVRRLGAALASALATVHAAGLVHRDVKPANVLVEDGTARRYRLTDFGIARLLEATRQTATGTTLGTAPYLAPEQVRGEAVTPASDVYALGLVLLECLTGHVEYGGPAVEAAVARLHRPPLLPDGLPADARQLLARMLADDPGERPDAAELARCWEGGAATGAAARPHERMPEPRLPADLRAAAGRRRERPASLRRRRRGTALLAAAALAAGLTGVAAVAVTAREPSPPPLPAPAVPGDTGGALDRLHEAVNG